MTDKLSPAWEKFGGEITTLLIRVGKNYDGASHPALLITAHRDEILSLFQQAFPELAKANGYFTLEQTKSTIIEDVTLLDPKRMREANSNVKSFLDAVASEARKGYVQLAKDQRLPIRWAKSVDKMIKHPRISQDQQDMLKAGFRKVAKAQLALGQQHEQARVEEVFKKIEELFTDIHSNGVMWTLYQKEWQALKKQEGIEL